MDEKTNGVIIENMNSAPEKSLVCMKERFVVRFGPLHVYSEDGHHTFGYRTMLIQPKNSDFKAQDSNPKLDDPSSWQLIRDI